VWDAASQREIEWLTNLMEFGPTTIAAIYKDRWEIELFLQSAEAESQGEELCGDQRKRSSNPDLDSLDRPSAAQMDTPSFKGEVRSSWRVQPIRPCKRNHSAERSVRRLGRFVAESMPEWI